MKKIDKLIFFPILFVLFLSCSSQQDSMHITLGDYFGEVSFHLNCVNDKYFGILESSASQVYEGDNSFNCKLLFIEKTHNIADGKLNFNVYNLNADSIECGEAIITTMTDSSIKLTIHPNDNIGMCTATIDFSEEILLDRHPNQIR